ncbi:MAG: cytochrome ubiquinol oxidase subunit I [Beijerinckiaceae bacterium]|nr:cytochrome ubiquinol oxidase subunit I [Beijerinckiaceae bacterium]
MLDGFDAILLARIQFAFTIALHILFPAFTIGLASYLFVLNALWLWTKDGVYLALFDHWKGIFAVVFAMGVVSGIVMSYQFGTNWSVFADRAGPVIGPLMGYEVLTAFFLEAGFLGVMLFGLRRVGAGLHLFATGMVATGTLGSAFWILAANSWMHTPAGHSINAAGQFVPESWFAIIFNPSFPFRLAHMVLAAFLTTAFAVGAAGAYRLLRDNRDVAAQTMFSMAMWMAALVTPVQIFAGDLHGINTLHHQPAKVAAMEGLYESRSGAPLALFGVPDDEGERLRYAVEIPKLGSIILAHDPNAQIRGLKEWPRSDRPPVLPVFYAFRVMVGLGVLMLVVGLWSLLRRAQARLYTDRRLHIAALAMGPSGFIAVLAGWMVTEIGRQPYTVYGLLRTAQSASPIAAPAVGASLIAFIVVYFVIFGAGAFYVLRLMSKRAGAPPDDEDRGPIRAAGITPAPSYDERAIPAGGRSP